MLNANLSIHKLLWLIVVFFPLLPNALGAQNAQKLMHLTLIGFLLLVILACRSTFPRKFLISAAVLTISLFIYYGTITVLNTRHLVFSDLPDLIRQFVYLGYILFAFAAPLEEHEFEELFLFFKKILVFQICFSALVYVSAFWPIVDIFKGRPSNDMALHFYRWSGTYGYPSDFSFFLSFFIFYYFSLYARRIAMSWKSIALIIMTILALFMTFSRGGIFSTLGVLGVLFWLTGAKKRKTSYLILITSFVGILGIFLIFSDKFQQVSYILQVFGNDSSGVDGSTGHRLHELSLAKEYAGKIPPFSLGANRVELATRISIIESFYGYHLIKFGALGLFFAIMCKTLIAAACIWIYKTYKENLIISGVAFAVAGLVMSELLFFGYSSAITDRFKTLPTFYLLTGYILYFLFQRKNRQHE